VHVVQSQHGKTQKIEGYQFCLNNGKLETKICGSGSNLQLFEKSWILTSLDSNYHLQASIDYDPSNNIACS